MKIDFDPDFVRVLAKCEVIVRSSKRIISIFSSRVRSEQVHSIFSSAITGPRQFQRHHSDFTDPEKRQAKLFDTVNDYVPYLFEMVDDEYKSHWEESISIANQIACLVTASAIRLGIDSSYMIETCIMHFIRYSLLPSKQHPNKSDYLSEKHADEYRDKLLVVQKVLGNCELDSLLKVFFYENNTVVCEKSLKFFIEIHHISFNLKYLPDLIIINRFLKNIRQVELHLDQLEDELQKYVALQPNKYNLLVREDGKYHLPDISSSVKEKYQRQKILSGFLYQWAQQHGFEGKAKVLVSLTREKFAGLLLTKSIFKDSAINVDGVHGPFSHAKQWYCIISASILHSPPLDLYQELGKQILDKANDIGMASPYNILWNIIFDQARGTNDFSNPEFFTRTLREPSNRHRWPLLSESVCRMVQKNEDLVYGKPNNYLNKKHANEKNTGIVFRKF